MSDIEHIGFWDINSKENKSETYSKQDLEAAFIAGRLMFLKDSPFFDGFYEFFSWYKIAGYEKMLQLQKKLSSDNVQEEHKGISETSQ